MAYSIDKSTHSGPNYSRLSSVTYPNGRLLDYIYNSGLDSDISRVSQLNDDAGTGAGSVEAYTYLGLDTIVQRLDGNGIELTYIKQSGESNGDAGDQYIGLDRFGRVVDQRWIPSGSPTAPTDRFQYGYDRDGNVLYKNNLVKSSFSELYHANSSASGDNNTAYDNLNRITGFRRGTLSSSANNSGGLDTVSTLNSNSKSSQSFTLDAVGNQTSVTTDGTAQTNTVNSQNQETAAGANNLAFDNNGNTTTDDQGHTLVYDAWNRLVQVKNGGTTLVTYAYDALGNRISRTASGTTTDLYNSAAGQVLEERQGSAVTNQYVWSLAYVNALILRDDNSTGGSYGKSSSGLGRRLYVQQDANFNVTTLTDTSGVVKQRFDYTPYGVMTVIDGTTNWSTTTDSYSWVYTFQGGRVDATVGMSHFGKREYSSSLGRWTEQDPASYINGANLYQFGLSAPVLYADPSGETADPATQPTTLPAPDTIDLGISVDSSVYGGGATIVPAMLGVLDRACQYCTDHYGTRRIHIAPHRSPNVLTAPEEYNRTNSPDILDTLDDVEGGAKIIITSKPVMSDGDAKGGIAFGKPGGGSHGAVITWPGGAAVLPHELGHIAGYDGGFPQGHAKPGSMVGDKPNLMCASGGDNPDEQWCKKLAQLAFQQWFKKYSNK